MTFGDKLRELRQGKGLSQVELAEKVQCKQQTLADWESGRYAPPFDAVHRICKALGVRCTVFDACEFAESEEKRGRGRPKKDS